MTRKLILAGAFLACILAANYVTSRYGFVPVGFGLMATAGTYFAGLSFVLRDSLQDAAGKGWTVATIAAGAVLSFVIADPFIAAASAAAFGISELVDFSIYTPLRRRGYVGAAIASNVAGSLVDSIVFLTVAGFPVWASLPGQMVGKTWIGLLGVGFVWWTRARRSRREAARVVSGEPVRTGSVAGDE